MNWSGGGGQCSVCLAARQTLFRYLYLIGVFFLGHVSFRASSVLSSAALHHSVSLLTSEPCAIYASSPVISFFFGHAFSHLFRNTMCICRVAVCIVEFAEGSFFATPSVMPVLPKPTRNCQHRGATSSTLAARRVFRASRADPQRHLGENEDGNPIARHTSIGNMPGPYHDITQYHDAMLVYVMSCYAIITYHITY